MEKFRKQTCPLILFSEENKNENKNKDKRKRKHVFPRAMNQVSQMGVYKRILSSSPPSSGGTHNLLELPAGLLTFIVNHILGNNSTILHYFQVNERHFQAPRSTSSEERPASCHPPHHLLKFSILRNLNPLWSSFYTLA